MKQEGECHAMLEDYSYANLSRLLSVKTKISSDVMVIPATASLRGDPKCTRTNDAKIFDGPFSFPRQPRSVRQKVHLS
ncbi:hypothetical protein WN943_018548 [Citrus x changshan-huyou]